MRDGADFEKYVKAIEQLQEDFSSRFQVIPVPIKKKKETENPGNPGFCCESRDPKKKDITDIFFKKYMYLHVF